jgi:hypothetical protein
MMKTRRKKDTNQIEMVETHNLYLSFQRLINSAPYDSFRVKRALYHAICMADLGGSDTKKLIREALQLP